MVSDGFIPKITAFLGAVPRDWENDLPPVTHKGPSVAVAGLRGYVS